ncbi:possible permease protein, ABC-type nitrate/sulfonate/bicarbonate transporter [Aurantimonas manganoxydans SI85-9A1]|uniref:Possible permease protein, ABC-type nitrate/sulfonate/bicarbonate transporter n=1 Tax=Aurantimonas manganoxydans (strain ATCC BAA-1229 / DSM 21871 / SI85-9A1) TaxID=287752 RepID=Q1YKX5_AURMS|nr:possible permease protein, ABC-type nitrate/sulfonate/bicarbonate transporter [Aurantimonas manganoxydans SI85-9A1]
MVPPLQAIVRALARLLGSAEFYVNLWASLYETAVALLVGGGAGLFVGIALGGSRFLGRAFEPYLYYLGPTPKIIFFPIMIMWFGVGPGSKMAMGAMSCFFPVALSVAVGMRAIPSILIRVGQSFRASQAQMVTKIYLPAMREPVVNGFRLGFGIALIGVLLAETKLSNQGLGFLVIQNYQRFDMPAMYALLIAVFALSILANAGISRLTRPGGGRAGK